MSTMGVALVVVLALLWVWLQSKKERAARKYTEVKKQVDKDASELDVSSNLSISFYFIFWVKVGLFYHFSINH